MWWNYYCFPVEWKAAISPVSFHFLPCWAWVAVGKMNGVQYSSCSCVTPRDISPVSTAHCLIFIRHKIGIQVTCLVCVSGSRWSSALVGCLWTPYFNASTNPHQFQMLDASNLSRFITCTFSMERVSTWYMKIPLTFASWHKLPCYLRS